ncbi:hypothetical protein B0H11DRAFT_1902459 [Mycena galericulata]|nr:hypothetical protein B0H11DRAFT_1902459 [Mycena galericulata]
MYHNGIRRQVGGEAGRDGCAWAGWHGSRPSVTVVWSALVLYQRGGHVPVGSLEVGEETRKSASVALRLRKLSLWSRWQAEGEDTGEREYVACVGPGMKWPDNPRLKRAGGHAALADLHCSLRRVQGGRGEDLAVSLRTVREGELWSCWQWRCTHRLENKVWSTWSPEVALHCTCTSFGWQTDGACAPPTKSAGNGGDRTGRAAQGGAHTRSSRSTTASEAGLRGGSRLLCRRWDCVTVWGATVDLVEAHDAGDSNSGSGVLRGGWGVDRADEERDKRRYKSALGTQQ